MRPMDDHAMRNRIDEKLSKLVRRSWRRRLAVAAATGVTVGMVSAFDGSARPTQMDAGITMDAAVQDDLGDIVALYAVQPEYGVDVPGCGGW